MSHAIIRGKNGRRHEVDFGNAKIKIEMHASEQVVEISIKGPDDPAPSDKQHFARWCQSNVNQSPNLQMMRISRRQLTPFGQRGGAIFFEGFAAVEMTFEIEMIVD